MKRLRLLNRVVLFLFVGFLSAPLFLGGVVGCNSSTKFVLTVALASETSGGTIDSSPGGIHCGSDCTEEYGSGVSVRLTPTANAGFVFAGWSGGGCTGTNPCTVTMNADTNVTATFAVSARVSLAVTGAGSGLVASDVGGIGCDKNGGNCTAIVPVGTSVTLTPTPDPGYFFNGWRGGVCQGPGPCTLTVNADTSLQASFVMVTFASQMSLDGTDASNSFSNIWTSLSDGSKLTHVTGLNHTGVPSVHGSFPAWSPDGDHITYSSNRNLTDLSPGAAPNGTTSNIWVSNADGSGGDIKLTQLTSHVVLSFPLWSPDGTKVSYESNRKLDLSDASQGNSFNIWVANADGSGGDVALTQVNTVSDSLNFGDDPWCPDGTKIAYSSQRSLNAADLTNPNSVHNIWIVNTDGSGGDFALTQATGAGVGDSSLPQWSPDSSQIVFVSDMALTTHPFTDPKNAAVNLWAVNTDGTGLTPLTRNTDASVRMQGPYWSPDGKKIAFVTNRNLTNTSDAAPANAVDNVWVINADGTSPMPVTSLQTASYLFSCLWSPDGKLILYDSNRQLDKSDVSGPQVNIWEVLPDGGAASPITDLVNSGVVLPNNYD